MGTKKKTVNRNLHHVAFWVYMRNCQRGFFADFFSLCIEWNLKFRQILVNWGKRKQKMFYKVFQWFDKTREEKELFLDKCDEASFLKNV